jgi:catalase
LKFYTTEGNYDIVGNDTPVFPARPAEISQFHPLAKASRRQQPA